MAEQTITYTLYSENPFDLEGVLVAPYLRYASGVSEEKLSSFLEERPHAVAISGKGLIRYGKKASQ